jgi:hypothetical protein
MHTHDIAVGWRDCAHGTKRNDKHVRSPECSNDYDANLLRELLHAREYSLHII